MAVKTQDQVRSAILSNKKFKSELITMFGAEVEIRQPNIGQVLSARDEEDNRKAIVNLMVQYCYVPGTNEKVFTPEDFNEIMGLPVGKWFSDMNDAIIRLTDIDIESAEKN